MVDDINNHPGKMVVEYFTGTSIQDAENWLTEYFIHKKLSKFPEFGGQEVAVLPRLMPMHMRQSASIDCVFPQSKT